MKNNIPIRSFIFGLAGLCTFPSFAASNIQEIKSQQKDDARPNILLIVADDMGFSDLGVTGGEISTPNLDSLAHNGTLFTDFNVSPMCAPTRGMLLTGTDSHLTGLATMDVFEKTPSQANEPGYVGYLNNDVVPFPSLLQESGYHTYIAGKWHLGASEELSPKHRGFDESFVMLPGAGSHFTTKGYGPDKAVIKYRENGKLLDELPDGFFSTQYYTDKIIEYIDKNRDDNKPFFAFISYTAPHWPLMAPDEWLDKYKNQYNDGFDVIKEQRIARMKELGLVDDSTTPYPFVETKQHKSWDKLTVEEKKYSARAMEIYASMVDNMDFNIGRLIEHLKKNELYENTVIVFLSDNGPHAGNPFNLLSKDQAGADWRSTYDESYENMGRPNSFVSYTSWAQVSAAPFRYFKRMPTNGGIRSPLIISYPKNGSTDKTIASFASVKDIAPTFLDFSGVSHPGTQYKGHAVYPIQGKSLLPVIKGESDTAHPDDTAMGWELGNNLAIRKGSWKAVNISSPKPLSTNGWRLFDLRNDPNETTDLSTANPEKMKEMLKEWELYMEENKVILSN